MTGQPERWDDVFSERPRDASSATNGGGTPSGTMVTPFAQPPQSYDSLREYHPEPSNVGPPGFAQQSPPQYFETVAAVAAAMTGQPPKAQQNDGGGLPTRMIWTLEFYQQFFDVDTRLVLARIANALVPTKPPDFLMNHDWRNGASQQPSSAFEEMDATPMRKPDMYGPFWISTTLWMTLAIVSNLMGQIDFNKEKHKDGKKWHYDFTFASVACTVIYFYCFGLGCILWGLMKYHVLPISLVDTLCLYGYSLFVFFPVIFLCMIPISVLQWIFVFVGGAWSAAYLLFNLLPLWMTRLNKAWFMGMVGMVCVFTTLLTLFFKFYFLAYKL